MYVRVLLLFVAAICVYGRTVRNKRSGGGGGHTDGTTYESEKQFGPFKATPMSGNKHMAASVKNYPLSPAEAYFGTGAHTHSFPLQTTHGKSPVEHSIGASGSDWGFKPVESTVNLEQIGVKHGHNVNGVDNHASHVNWTDHYDKYQDNLKATHAAQGTNPHPHFQTPTHFFGADPFHHNTGVTGGNHSTGVVGTHNIPDFGVIKHGFVPSTDEYSHGHQLPGVNNFKSLNYTDKLSNFLPAHANHAATLEAGDRVPVVNPKLITTTTAPTLLSDISNNPFMKNYANPPKAGSTNPFATVGAFTTGHTRRKRLAKRFRQSWH